MLVDLLDIPERITNPCVNDHKLGVFLNTQNFWAHVLVNYKTVDVITYTWTYQLQNIRRLIVGNISCYTPELDKTKLRCGPRLHTKLVLGYNTFRTKPVAAYVGSLNLVLPTMHDIMLRIDDKPRVKLLQNYFEQMWEACDNPS